MFKIKWKNIFSLIYWLLIITLLIYSRFINLGWGLPYPMHPDENNMAIAIQKLNCQIQNSNFKIQDCFNPHFFAYGQFPLYLGYIVVLFIKLFSGNLTTSTTFPQAILSLRFISAIASAINFFIIIKIIKITAKNKKIELINYLTTLLLIFSPFFIQFAHFGTTESLLMLFYSLIIYYSLKLIKNKNIKNKYHLIIAIFFGLAMATKLSALIFIVVPLIVIFKLNKLNFLSKIFQFICLSLLIWIIFSPHNLLSFNEFMSSLNYEAMVASGKMKVFYTRQFVNSLPILFQFEKIFPYALGWPILILGGLGFFYLSWQDKKINLLRLAFLSYFLPNSFLFAKWTRFMAPIFPLILTLAILFLQKIKITKIIKIVIIIIAILPGIAYLSIYQKSDVRFQASLWMVKNFPPQSLILSETANVVDIPFVLPPNSQNNIPNYHYISFNFYDLDTSFQLKNELFEYLNKADYIIIPSRRIFANHFCSEKNNFLISYSQDHCQYLKKTYPFLNQYYQSLFTDKLPFKKIKDFNSFPKIEIFGKKIIEFNDENAEETFSVFDHPVIRIFKNNK